MSGIFNIEHAICRYHLRKKTKIDNRNVYILLSVLVIAIVYMSGNNFKNGSFAHVFFSISITFVESFRL